MLGLANYGRSDAPAMPYTGFKGESGFLSYYESCLMLTCEKWKEFWNEAQLVPYAKGKENYPWAGTFFLNSRLSFNVLNFLNNALNGILTLSPFASRSLAV